MYDKVIIVGPYLYHNDSYINFGFYNSFFERNKNTYWIHKKNINNISNIDHKNVLYIINTNDIEMIKNIPIDNSNYYVIIKCPSKKFENVNNLLIIKEYYNDINIINYEKLDDYIYKKDKEIIMPYGSILTKSQIIENLEDFINIENREDKIIYTGSYNNIDHNDIIKTKCNYTLIKKLISIEEEIKLIQKILLSCCFPLNKNKIDIKTLSHISYGGQILTNSKFIKDFFNNKCLYIENIDSYNYKKLLQEAKKTKKEDIFHMIQKIINNYTFESRIKIINNYFKI